jgi:hypothetical protein
VSAGPGSISASRLGSAPGRCRMSISSSAFRRQVVISSGARSSVALTSRRVAASSDSVSPNSRSRADSKGRVRASTALAAEVASAAGHIACSSRGGPGSTITVGPPATGTTSPGAVPTGSSGCAPRGTIACLRFATCSACGLTCLRWRNRARMAVICRSSASSSSSSTPANPATTSAVRSSAVGPSPPLVMTRSTRWLARNRNAAARSAGRSPTRSRWATSTPNSPSRCASHGPLRSVIRPLSSSVPVTTIPARTSGPSFLTRRHASGVRGLTSSGKAVALGAIDLTLAG